MTGFLTDLRIRARLMVRAAAFSAAGIIFCTVGFAFLTAALWLLIATHEGAMTASLVLGFAYFLVGLCIMLIGQRPASRRRRATPPPPTAAQGAEPFLRMAEAFAVGMQAGRNARRPPR